MSALNNLYLLSWKYIWISEVGKLVKQGVSVTECNKTIYIIVAPHKFSATAPTETSNHASIPHKLIPKYIIRGSSWQKA